MTAAKQKKIALLVHENPMGQRTSPPGKSPVLRTNVSDFRTNLKIEDAFDSNRKSHQEIHDQLEAQYSL